MRLPRTTIQNHTLTTRAIFPVIYLALRYYAAWILLGYGFAKLMGAQFTVLDSQLARPMGEVSGFWLTWYYFGYSPVYSAMVALVQIAGAVLLCFRRTALFGALILLPVMVNIVCIDVWVIGWRLESDALRNAIYVLAALLAILAFHGKGLWSFFLRQKDGPGLFATARPWMLALQMAVAGGMLAYAAHEGYWLANVNNRAPTPIDGAWRVTSMEPAVPEAPDWIYFEYNRAFMTIFQYPGGRQEMHDFRVDPAQKTLAISQEWLTQGAEIFKGGWERNGDDLILKGMWAKDTPVTIVLKRKQMPVKDHS